jgi:transposase
LGGDILRQTIIAEHLTAENLRERMLLSESKEQFQRWQTLYVLKTKVLCPNETAEIVGVSTGTVHQWVHLYNHSGPEGYALKGRGGRRSAHMTLEQEADLLESLSTDAGKGLIITAWNVQRRVKEKTGRKVSDDFIYDLFKRHGWRKVAPRPQHPKSRKEKQEAFKKNSPRLWMPPRKSSAKATIDR